MTGGRPPRPGPDGTPSRRRQPGTPATLLLALLAAALWARPAGALEVVILQPGLGEPLLGPAVIELDVFAEQPVAAVDVRLDGQLIGRLERPPWRLSFDAGRQNRERLLEVEVRDIYGAVGRARRVTPAIAIHDEIDVDLQQLYVSVRRGSEWVEGLSVEDFRVLDDGHEEQIAVFQRGDVPLSAVLALDASLSMRGAPLATALDGARGFAQALLPHDWASVLLFSDELIHWGELEPGSAHLPPEVAAAEASGGTALNDALYLATKALEPRPGRQVVVLLSDGVDLDSTLFMRQVLWSARHTQAIVFWLRLREGGVERIPINSTWRDREGHRRELEVLGQLVEESGGRILDIASIAQAVAALQEILVELRAQYILGYYPTRHRRGDGDWRTLQVRVRGPGYSVTTRRGYLPP